MGFYLLDWLEEFTPKRVMIFLTTVYVATILLCLLLSVYRILYIYEAFRSTERMPDTKKRCKFAILIPARNESSVIRNIIASLKAQTYDSKQFDVYVIVETVDDPTVKIVEEAGYKVVIRGPLDGRRTKGFALDDALQEILKKGLAYDAYAVFDADNILAENYIEELNKCYQAGYQVGLGFRNSKNCNTNWISSCSVLTFTQINSFNNKARSKYFNKVGLSGTGFFIDAKIVNKEKRWIWNGLTEDAELSYYCVVNDIKCKYLDYIEYYDEQPTTLSVIKQQHLRWIRGYAYTSKIYMGKLITSLFKGKKWYVLDYLLSYVSASVLLEGTIRYVLSMGVLFILTQCSYAVYAILGVLFVLYFSLFIYSIALVMADRKRFKFLPEQCVLLSLVHPLYMSLYAIHAVESFFQKKEYAWTEIAHKGQ